MQRGARRPPQELVKLAAKVGVPESLAHLMAQPTVAEDADETEESVDNALKVGEGLVCPSVRVRVCVCVGACTLLARRRMGRGGSLGAFCSGPAHT